MSSIRTKPAIVLGPESNGILMTGKEFDAVEEYDKEYRYELIRGVLVVSPIPSARETGPDQELGRLLLNYQQELPQGKVLDDTLPQQYVYVSPSTRRQADRLIWTGLGRWPDPKTDLPTIVVEFVSASRRDWERDYLVKRREYKKCGIPEYWVFDRFRRTMTVFIHQRGKEQEIVLGEKDVYRTPRLPGFELPLQRIFFVADRGKPGKRSK